MIKKAGEVIRLIVSGGAEMCWLYAWAAFLTNAVMGRPYSFWGAVGVFLFAAVCTVSSTGKGWRIIQVASLQVLSFSLVVLLVLHGTYYPGHRVLSQVWVRELFGGSHGPLEWINLVMITVWTLFFWIGGARLIRRPKAYFTACTRFDIGLAAFFCLFLAKLVLVTKGGMRIDDRSLLLPVYPFFLLSLLSIGMVRPETHFSKSFLPGYRGLGVMASFAATVILTAIASILFFLPGMTAAAETGYRVVRGGGALLFPLLVGVIRFMFMGRSPRPEPAGTAPKEHALNWFGSPGSWWMELIEKVIGWGVKGFMLIFLCFMLGFVIFWVVRWLFSRTAFVERDERVLRSVQPWWAQLWTALILLWGKVVRSIRGYGRATEYYEALLSWGRHGGISHSLSETPLEFADRLGRCFPRLSREIGLIVEAFHEEVYADACPAGAQLADVRSAMRTLRSPLHWPTRMKARFRAT